MQSESDNLKLKGRGSHLYAFDFDQTITEAYSDTALTAAVLQTPVPNFIQNIYDTTNNWAKYMDALMKHLASEGISMEVINRRLLGLELLPGVENLLQKIRLACSENSRSKLLIISDGNDYFIKIVLNNLTPPVIPDAVVTNEATICTPSLDATCNNDDVKIPYLKIESYETQTKCTMCPPNLCKGDALGKYITESGPFEKVFYAGDGSNDLCPAMRLRQDDVLFVRKGFGLERCIVRGTGKNTNLPVSITSKIVYFENGSEIEKHIMMPC